jgi:RNase H-fold protein (predicted Holliday junction resolvase)
MRLVTEERGRNSRKPKKRASDADTDALAASIILQAYLDAQRFTSEPAP